LEAFRSATASKTGSKEVSVKTRESKPEQSTLKPHKINSSTAWVDQRRAKKVILQIPSTIERKPIYTWIDTSVFLLTILLTRVRKSHKIRIPPIELVGHFFKSKSLPEFDSHV
jgi:hypothetical protein